MNWTNQSIIKRASCSIQKHCSITSLNYFATNYWLSIHDTIAQLVTQPSNQIKLTRVRSLHNYYALKQRVFIGDCVIFFNFRYRLRENVDRRERSLTGRHNVKKARIDLSAEIVGSRAEEGAIVQLVHRRVWNRRASTIATDQFQRYVHRFHRVVELPAEDHIAWIRFQLAWNLHRLLSCHSKHLRLSSTAYRRNYNKYDNFLNNYFSGLVFFFFSKFRYTRSSRTITRLVRRQLKRIKEFFPRFFDKNKLLIELRFWQLGTRNNCLIFIAQWGGVYSFLLVHSRILYMCVENSSKVLFASLQRGSALKAIYTYVCFILYISIR